MKRYTFKFSDGKTFSCVAEDVDQAESYLSEPPIKLMAVDHLPPRKLGVVEDQKIKVNTIMKAVVRNY